MSKINKPKRRSPLSHGKAKHLSGSIRERVLNAAFSLFREQGFSPTSMLDIVTRARVSKRDLYALFNNKHALLAACISQRTQQMRQSLDTAIPMPQTRQALAALLVELGTSILDTVCHPDVLTIFRLAIAESDRAPEIARTLHRNGREANQKALTELIRKAQSLELVPAGNPGAMAAGYFSALWGDLLVGLLMRVWEAPTKQEMELRARTAAEKLLTPTTPSAPTSKTPRTLKARRNAEKG